MSDVAFEWKLTPAERRIAEMAFAGGAARFALRPDVADLAATIAVHAVKALRGLESACSDGENLAMLAELRCEPPTPCDEHDYRITRLVEGATTHREQSERYRALLERAEANAIDDDWLRDVRKELGR